MFKCQELKKKDDRDLENRIIPEIFLQTCH